jgi:hypothetical protein
MRAFGGSLVCTHRPLASSLQKLGRPTQEIFKLSVLPSYPAGPSLPLGRYDLALCFWSSHTVKITDSKGLLSVGYSTLARIAISIRAHPRTVVRKTPLRELAQRTESTCLKPSSTYASVRCICGNQGKTPARIIEKRACLLVVPPSNPLPENPNLDIDIQDATLHYLQTGDETKRDWMLTGPGAQGMGDICWRQRACSDIQASR